MNTTGVEHKVIEIKTINCQAGLHERCEGAYRMSYRVTAKCQCSCHSQSLFQESK